MHVNSFDIFKLAESLENPKTEKQEIDLQKNI